VVQEGDSEPVGRDARVADPSGRIDGQFLPDGKRIAFAAGEAGRGRRLYVQTISGGTPASISPGGIRGSIEGLGIGPVSPDGRFVAAWSPDGRLRLYPTSPGDSLPVSGVVDGEFPIQWSPDGKSLYVKGPGELPARVFRVNPVSGKRELWKQFAASDPTGVVVQGIVMTPDAAAYAYTYVRLLSDLYVAAGLE
jgi:WD40 repeat protein